MQTWWIIMATIAIQLGFTPESEQVLARWQDAPQRVAQALERGMRRSLVDVENYLKVSMLSGQAGGGAGGSTPVGLRSGQLRQAISHELDGPLTGTVGTTEGPTSRYARVILGPDATTIRPRRAQHLYVPIADNLGPSMQARLSPRAAFERGARIITSRRGNKVVFLPDAQGGRYTRGQKKGLPRGKLLFVLAAEVTVQGTDALALGVTQRLDRLQQIFNEELGRALP